MAGEGGVGQCLLFGLGKYKAGRRVNSYSRQYRYKLPSRQKVGGIVATPVKQMKRHFYINNVHFMKSMLTEKKRGART